jgi:hypothetical protein
MRIALPLLLLAVTATVHADDPMCATSAENDARVRALHERVTSRGRLIENAATPAAIARDGAFYLAADDRVIPGYRPFDLEGQSLVFEPHANGRYAVHREALHWIEPASAPIVDFASPGTLFVRQDLSGPLPLIFGNPVSTLYLSAFNGIHLSPPNEPSALQFDALEAAVYREPLLSPLMITNRKPGRLSYPQVFVERSAGNVVITWRSTSGVFGYDIQAELHTDGSIVYSYKSLREMRWGTPIVSNGFAPAVAARRTLGGFDDLPNDLVSGAVESALANVNDIRRVEVVRIGESDLIALRLTLGATVDSTKLTGTQALRYIAQLGTTQAWLDINRNGWTVTPFAEPRAITNGGEVHFDGNVIELYGMQAPSDAGVPLIVRVWTVAPASGRTIDFATANLFFDVPARSVTSDLSAIANGSELPLPISEAFVLGDFDPFSVWERLQSAFSLSSYDIDAVAMYQTFYTDLVFYAGAYSTGGNPGVDGIAPPSPVRSSTSARIPSLLHMNQLTYGWNTTDRNSGHVMLHELGHRWLYFFRISDGGQLVRALNPVSAHPAGFVQTPSAFRVYDDNESSVMGGAMFTEQSDGRFRAHAANYGYSWTDLYLMGLATASEVQPWFYLANTVPALPQEYWPPEGAVVTAQRRDVTVQQIIAAEGARNPSTALSQRLFRVVFVLVTDTGVPTDEEVAKVNQWRALLEKNFSIATGNRARVETTWVQPTKRRAVR